MPFTAKLRPFFRRISSKYSSASTISDPDTDTTAATSNASSSPDLPADQQPRKSSSLSKLPAKLREEEARTGSLPSLRKTGRREQQLPEDDEEEVQTPRRAPRRAATSPLALASPTRQRNRLKKELAENTDSNTIAKSGQLGKSQETDAEAQPVTPPPLRLDADNDINNANVVVTLQEATPDALGSADPRDRPVSGEITLVPSDEDLQSRKQHSTTDLPSFNVPAASPSHSVRSLHLPSDVEQRRQSIVGSANANNIVKTLVDLPAPAADRPHTGTSYSTTAIPTAGLRDFFTPSVPNMAHMLHRKIWVKRPNASATLVQIKDDDLVDDVRDMILRKYANSLGRTFDAPDMTLRIVSRSEHGGPRTERVLGPEEEICRTIDACYPGGQTVDEALIIDVPPKRTPRPSPRNYQNSYHALDEFRPQENGNDYFPPMPAIIQPTLPHNHHHHGAPGDHPRSISVLNTGQVPPLPSPGGRRHRAEREHRPKYGRQHTSSPTIITHSSAAPIAGPSNLSQPPAHIPHRVSGRARVDSSASEAHVNGVPAPPPLPTPPAPDAPAMARTNSQPPTPSGMQANGHRSARPKKTRKPTPEKPSSRTRKAPPQADPYGTNPALPNVSSMLDGSVPPINVLIVEDNIINLRILEGLMKRLKVRWQTAMNGQIAVDKWKLGGYHLVLMDIQMPIMNGLQATKEIRRLERVNGIGVFSSSSPGSPDEGGENADGKDGQAVAKSHNPEDDKLPKGDGMFKSPVIIVALTASSLQSDRHEALAAGCNDFLTKPVNFVWLERKVKEWGCMQALIDFDGWRKWKDYAAKKEEGKTEEQKKKEREDEEKAKTKMEKMAILQEKQKKRKEEEEKKKAEQKAKRESLEAPQENGEAAA